MLYHRDSIEKNEGKPEMPPNMNITFREAGYHDIKILSLMNHELIQDEKSNNPMNLEQLEGRFKELLMSEYKAVLILLDNKIIGYCLYRHDNCASTVGYDIYIRQYYINRNFRRRGIGRAALNGLLQSVFRNASMISLDVLESNPVGQAFWLSMGFQPYYHRMQLPNPFK